MSEQRFKPADRVVDASEWRAAGLCGPGNHDDWQAERACGFDLAEGFGAAGILRNDDVDRFLPHQGLFGLGVEGRARGDQLEVRRQSEVAWCVDRAGDVAVLRRIGEGFEFEAAHGEKDAARLGAKLLGGVGRISCVDPVVAGGGRPFGAEDAREGAARSIGGRLGILRNLRRVGVRGINQGVDLVFGEVAGEALCAAETANSSWQRLARGGAGSARKRDRGRKARVYGEAFAEFSCFACAA